MKNIFLAVIAYEGKVVSDCAESLLHNTHVLRSHGYNVTPYFHNGDCYIARARNLCVEVFLQSDCTDLIFIDADVAFDKDAILKLMKHDKGIVAGVYPYRKDQCGYPAVLRFNEANNCLDEETGLVMAESVPTGLMRISRYVFGRMIDSYQMERGIPAAGDKEGFYHFFDTGQLFEGDKTWYGEDTYFCKRWRNMGEDIWIEPNINFSHIGQHKFKGNYFDFLSSGGM